MKYSKKIVKNREIYSFLLYALPCNVLVHSKHKNLQKDKSILHVYKHLNIVQNFTCNFLRCFVCFDKLINWSSHKRAVLLIDRTNKAVFNGSPAIPILSCCGCHTQIIFILSCSMRFSHIPKRDHINWLSVRCPHPDTLVQVVTPAQPYDLIGGCS